MPNIPRNLTKCENHITSHHLRKPIVQNPGEIARACEHSPSPGAQAPAHRHGSTPLLNSYPISSPPKTPKTQPKIQQQIPTQARHFHKNKHTNFICMSSDYHFGDMGLGFSRFFNESRLPNGCALFLCRENRQNRRSFRRLCHLGSFGIIRDTCMTD